MLGSVFPGDTMVIAGAVDEVTTDPTGCGWVSVRMTLSVEGDTKTTCTARIALPVTRNDNPWARRGDAWRP
jgi:hypothetical protein